LIPFDGTSPLGSALILSESVQRFEVRLYLFCLMSNHIHLVVETLRAALKLKSLVKRICGWV